MELPFSHSYAEAMPDGVADTQPDKVSAPQLVYLNTVLAEEMEIPWQSVAEDALANLFSGNALPDSARPVAQAYAGHQFGQFNPQLGDGRAVILGELTLGDEPVEVGLKGSGRTCFSRGGDGKAALGPMLREVLISEAMHAMGVPSTRSLAAVTTGETVYRQSPEPGAILTRVAASHIRVGTFQYFASRQQLSQLATLTDFALARHYPDANGTDEPALMLLKCTAKRQAALIARWMSIGFIHGVMNTDNMTISGETIDYGPCAFMEQYDEETVFSSIDHQGRYAFGNQPGIGQWDLARLAEALLPLIDEDQQVAIEKATDALGEYADSYELAWYGLMFSKLGLSDQSCREDDKVLVTDWLTLLSEDRADYTLSHRYLSGVLGGNEQALRALFSNQDGLSSWLARWRDRSQKETRESQDIAAQMNATNPRIIPRNHLVEQALNAATETGSLVLFNRLLAAVQQPFSEDAALEEFVAPADSVFTRGFQTFCGT